MGFGDALSVQYGQSFGTDSNAHGSGINPNLNVRYVVPFTPYDTTFAVDYRRVDFTVIESSVKPLDITGKFEAIGFTLRQPVFRTPSQEFALALTGQSESFRTSLLGSPFEFQSWIHQRTSPRCRRCASRRSTCIARRTRSSRRYLG